MTDIPWEVDPRNQESFLNYECECGANFSLSENRINKDKIRCPACKKEYDLKEGSA